MKHRGSRAALAMPRKALIPLLDPYCVAVQRWDTLVACMLLYTALITPFEVGFLSGFPPSHGSAPESAALASGFRTALFVLNRVCDGVFVLDITAQFNISFLDPQTRRLSRSRRAVARRYLASGAAVDLVSTIPFDLIAWAECGGDCAGRGSSFLRALVVLRVLKMLRLSRVSRVLTRLHERGNVRSGYISLFKYLCTMLVLNHWLACGLHAVAQFEGAACNWILNTFAGGCSVPAEALLPEELPSIGSVYIAALLWSTQTALTVGYGDIVAVTDAERAYVVAAMLVSGAFYSFIIGAFVGVVQQLNVREAEREAGLDGVNDFIEAAQLPRELAGRLRAFFWQQEHSPSALEAWRDLLDRLSPALRGDVAFAVNVAWIRSISVFQKAPSNLLIELSVAFRSIYFPPGEQLQTRGDDNATASLLVLQRGVVCCTSQEPGLRLHFAGRSGSLLFGIEALRPGCRSAQTVVSVGPVRAHALRCYAFNALVAGFPQFMPHVRRVALRSCLAWRLRNLVAAMHRVRAALAAAPKDAVLHLSDLIAAALETEEGARLIEASPALRMSAAQRVALLAGVAGGGDHVTVQFALMAAQLAAPMQYARVEKACMIVQRVWRGHAGRKQAARAAGRRRTAARLSLLLLKRSSSFGTLCEGPPPDEGSAESGIDDVTPSRRSSNPLAASADNASSGQRGAVHLAVTRDEFTALSATLAQLVKALEAKTAAPAAAEERVLMAEAKSRAAAQGDTAEGRRFNDAFVEYTAAADDSSMHTVS